MKKILALAVALLTLALLTVGAFSAKQGDFGGNFGGDFKGNLAGSWRTTPTRNAAASDVPIEKTPTPIAKFFSGLNAKSVWGFIFLLCAAFLEYLDARQRSIDKQRQEEDAIWQIQMRKREIKHRLDHQATYMEWQFQKKLDAAVAAELAKRGITETSALSPDSQTPIPYLIEGYNEFSWVCSICGCKQRNNRKVCFNCEAIFAPKPTDTSD